MQNVMRGATKSFSYREIRFEIDSNGRLRILAARGEWEEIGPDEANGILKDISFVTIRTDTLIEAEETEHWMRDYRILGADYPYMICTSGTPFYIDRRFLDDDFRTAVKL